MLRLLNVICIVTIALGSTAVGAATQADSQELGEDQTAILTAPSLPVELLTQAPQNLDEVRLLEQHVQSLLDKVRPATVALSGGSGVVVTKDGYVLTCAHVNQRPGRKITVTFPDGKRVSAVTLGNNHGVDAGLVKITEPGDFPFVPMGRSSDARAGQWCLALGYPVSFQRGKPPAVRLGRVSVNKPRMLVTDCLIMGGDSGGPLFDLDGNVIGINSRVNNSLETNIHIPVEVYRESWDQFVAGQDWSDQVPRTYLGITRDGESEQVRIAAVKPNSPAARAGFQVGDVIIRFEDKAIANFDELLKCMGDHKPKDTVQLTILRGETTIRLAVELADWPQG